MWHVACFDNEPFFGDLAPAIPSMVFDCLTHLVLLAIELVVWGTVSNCTCRRMITHFLLLRDLLEEFVLEVWEWEMVVAVWVWLKVPARVATEGAWAAGVATGGGWVVSVAVSGAAGLATGGAAIMDASSVGVSSAAGSSTDGLDMELSLASNRGSSLESPILKEEPCSPATISIAACKGVESPCSLFHWASMNC